MNHNAKIRAVIWGMDGVLVREPVSGYSQTEVELDQHLVEFIRAMRPDLQTALLVSSWSEVWQTVAHRPEIDTAFDRVILPAEGRRPEERLVSQAAGELGLRPSEAVFVDDSAQRVNAARSAGMRAVHFENPAQAGSLLLEMLMEPVG